MSVRLLPGDCIETMRSLPANSVDSVCTDPPYHLLSTVKRFANSPRTESTMPKSEPHARMSVGFMGKTWDGGDIAFRPETWAEVLRVLKPGGHLVAFGAPKNAHRLTCAIEDAGFEIRDSLMWLFGSGFPKSLDISKAIDKHLGAEREKVAPRSVIGHQRNIGNRRPYVDDPDHKTDSDDPATAAAAAWQGWGTALKPAYEPIILARKPIEGTNAENVLRFGVGALNIDASRVPTDEDRRRNARGGENGLTGTGTFKIRERRAEDQPETAGRWPANVIHDGSDEVLAAFPDAPGQIADASSSSDSRKTQNVYGDMKRGNGRDGEASAERTYEDEGGTNFAMKPGARRSDSGSAARFFKNCKESDAEWLAQNLDLSPALTAAGTLSLLNPVVSSALGRAVSLALPAGLCCGNLSAALSTIVTVNELRTISNAAIETMQDFAQKCLYEWRHEKLSPNGSRVSVAAERKPTGTTTITVDHWRSDGSADPVTFDITSQNSVVGGADFGRAFYHPKANKKDRAGSKHPTVKPIALMRYLCRLITPPGGTILDPFAGSGTTGQAASEEGFNAILCEREAEYIADINRRLGLSNDNLVLDEMLA